MTFVDEARSLVRQLEELDPERFVFAPPRPREELPSDWPGAALDFYSTVTASGPGLAKPVAFEEGGERAIFVVDYGCGSYGALWASGARRGQVSFFHDVGAEVDEPAMPFEDWAIGMLRSVLVEWVERRTRTLVERELAPNDREWRAIESVASHRVFQLGDGPTCVAMLRGDFAAAERALDVRHGKATRASGVARHHYWRAILRRREGRLADAREETERGLTAERTGDVGSDLRRLRIEVALAAGDPSAQQLLEAELPTTRSRFVYEALTKLLVAAGDLAGAHALLQRGVASSIGVRPYDHEGMATEERRMREFYEPIVSSFAPDVQAALRALDRGPLPEPRGR